MLPPDLDRLGDDLVAAAHRKTTRRERRGRLALAGVVGALAFAALNPATLDPAHRDVFILHASAEQFVEPGCELPRGARFSRAACEEAMVLYRPYAVQ